MRRARRIFVAGTTCALLAVAANADAQTNTVSTVAGTGTSGFSGDGGPATQAQLGIPTGLAFTPGGGFVESDQANDRVRRVLPDGTIITIAGSGSPAFGGDGGPALQAGISAPNGILFNSDGSTIFADSNHNRVRVVDAGGTINTFAGDGNAAFGGD